MSDLDSEEERSVGQKRLDVGSVGLGFLLTFTVIGFVVVSVLLGRLLAA